MKDSTFLTDKEGGVGRYLRPALPMNRAVLRRLGLSVGIAIALAGCDQKAEPLSWLESPNDPQVYVYVLNQCLTATRGPQATRYNDWDEAIEECGQRASIASTYCPPAKSCRPSVSSRADVRAILPAQAMSAGTVKTEGLGCEATPARSEGCAQEQAHD